MEKGKTESPKTVSNPFRLFGCPCHPVDCYLARLLRIVLDFCLISSPSAPPQVSRTMLHPIL